MGFIFNALGICAAYLGYKLIKSFFRDDKPINYPNYNKYNSYSTTRDKYPTHQSYKYPTTPEKTVQTQIKPKKTFFKANHMLPMYLPEKNNFLNLLKINNAQCSTPRDLLAVFKSLIELEDLENLKTTYVELTQTDVKLKLGTKRNIFTITTNCKNPENYLIPFDDIFIIRTSDPLNNFINKYDKDNDKILNVLLNTNKEVYNGIYHGKILDVSDSTKSVQFECNTLSGLRLFTNERYTIIFRSARYTYRYQYRALELFNTKDESLLKQLLFPIKSESISLTSSSLHFFNPRIKANSEQGEAVQRILFRPNYKSAPFILFGPPGTGKTTTIIESILQIYKEKPKTNILVMANSNTACNEIALRLLRINKSISLIRIFSRSMEKQIETLDKLLLKEEHSNLTKTDHYYPSVGFIQNHRILICTLSGAGKLALGDFGNKDSAPVYSYVFVDEAAACTEPEILMGLIDVISPNVNLILSGDHKQLGPVLHSKIAKKNGLGVSFMERLLKNNCYYVDRNGKYDRNNQIRLINNYRSHPAIVQLFNHLYYNNELKAKANGEKLHLSHKLNRVVKQKFPIVFHAVHTKCKPDENSSSSYNEGELSTVIFYIKELLVKGTTFTTKDIGIISPYKAQYNRIQQHLKQNNWQSIECGSCETFQGKEKRIIIASFVRSDDQLGFLSDPQRLNVTISRAQDLLILIGHPGTLCKCSGFKYIINKCKSNGVFVDDETYKRPLITSVLHQNSNQRSLSTRTIDT